MGKQIMKHVYTSINSDIKLYKVYLNMEQYLPFEKIRKTSVECLII